MNKLLPLTLLALLLMLALVETAKKYREREERIYSFIVALAGLAYLGSVLYFTAFWGPRAGLSGVNLRIKLPLLRAILDCAFLPLARTHLLNILLFVPFGYLLPQMRRTDLGRTALAGLCFSLVIESSQTLFHFGVFQADDLIDNTLGTLLGFLLFFVFNRRTGRRGEERRKEDKALIELSNEELFLLDALRQSLQPETERLQKWQGADLNERAIVSMILSNGVLLTVYPCLDGFPDIQKALSSRYYSSVSQAMVQDYEGQQILERLSRAGLDCIALKGWEMRKLYPQDTMRQMSDLDILVRPYAFEKIREIMLELGYRAGDEECDWKHDNYSKDVVKVEMHKRLTDDSGAVRKWEREMWGRCVRAEGNDHIFRMSDEDYFIFHIVHLHKDFMNGSLGLRRIADTWLFTDSHPELDQAFLESEFEKMGLALFAGRMVALGKAAMGETDLDENSRIMLRHAFRTGIFGSSQSYKLGRIVSFSGGSLRRGKIRSLFAAVFLPFGRMKAQFPILEKRPALLPLYWAKRALRHLRGNLGEKKKMLDYSGLGEEEFTRMKEFFEAGGIL